MEATEAFSDYGILECECHPSSWPDIHSCDDAFKERISLIALRAASYLSDPICKSHELFRRIYVVDALNPAASKLANLGRKFFLFVGLAGCGAVGIFTTIPSIILRYVAAHLRKEPFTSSIHADECKTLPDNHTFSLLSWNACCTSAGYTISDGGVLPWSFRIDDIVDKILESDADVNCLYEIFDPEAAFYICERLKQEGYTHFYFNIGSRAVGVSSGILVASRYAISDAEFTPFSDDMLVGRTKLAAKGVFAFDIVSEGKSFARIFATHLQHSEQPEFATPAEVEARRLQMELIMEKISTVRDRCIVLTGDLNLDDTERNRAFWRDSFDQGTVDDQGQKTWGGDEFCALMTGKQVSGPLNLDYTMVLNDTAKAISSTLISTGFDPALFQPEALSDHTGILSTITV